MKEGQELARGRGRKGRRERGKKEGHSRQREQRGQGF